MIWPKSGPPSLPRPPRRSPPASSPRSRRHWNRCGIFRSPDLRARRCVLGCASSSTRHTPSTTLWFRMQLSSSASCTARRTLQRSPRGEALDDGRRSASAMEAAGCIPSLTASGAPRFPNAASPRSPVLAGRTTQRSSSPQRNRPGSADKPAEPILPGTVEGFRANTASIPVTGSLRPRPRIC